jgi:hypothetical protein
MNINDPNSSSPSKIMLKHLSSTLVIAVSLAIETKMEDASLGEHRTAAIYNVRRNTRQTDAREQHYDTILMVTYQRSLSTKRKRLFDT